MSNPNSILNSTSPLTVVDPSFYRINEHEWFMNFAKLASLRSTCCRMKTGAVIVKEGRIVGMGYNGVGVGQLHCHDYWFQQYQQHQKTYSMTLTWENYQKSLSFLEGHHTWATMNEIHGEHNAILFAAKNGICTQDTTMYSLYSPCTHCAKAIIQSGIKKVYYHQLYEKDLQGLILLNQQHIHHEKIEMSSELIVKNK